MNVILVLNGLNECLEWQGKPVAGEFCIVIQIENAPIFPEIVIGLLTI